MRGPTRGSRRSARSSRSPPASFTAGSTASTNRDRAAGGAVWRAAASRRRHSSAAISGGRRARRRLAPVHDLGATYAEGACGAPRACLRCRLASRAAIRAGVVLFSHVASDGERTREAARSLLADIRDASSSPITSSACASSARPRSAARGSRVRGGRRRHVALNPAVGDDRFLDQCRLLYSEVVEPLRAVA